MSEARFVFDRATTSSPDRPDRPGRPGAPAALSVLHVRSSQGRHGPERVLLELLPALAKERVAVHVLALHRSLAAPAWLDEARAAGAAASTARDPAPLSPAALRAIRRSLHGVDLVHSHDYRADLLVWAALKTLRLRPPWVATVHLHTESTARLRAWRRLDLLALRGAALVTTVSSNQAAALLRFGLSADRLHHLPNAIDADRFAGVRSPGPAGRAHDRPLDLRGAALRRSLLGAPEAGPLLVHVGRLSAQKGIDVLLDGLVELRRAYPSLVLALAGDGPDRASLEAQADRLGLSGGLRWLGPVHDVAALLAAADVVVLPSRREGHPMVLLEAMAVGAPIVASRIPGIEEAVVEGESALLVPPEDPAALGTAIALLLYEPAAARALGTAAAAQVRHRYGPAGIAGRLAALYRAVVAEEPSAP